jgi:peptidyl-prolyl cis-trans isomerase B (cyclophilin B)
VASVRGRSLTPHEERIGTTRYAARPMSGRSGINRAAATLVTLLGVAALIVASCGGGGGEDETESSLPSGCQSVEKPAPKQVKLRRPKAITSPGSVNATVETSCGSFEITLDPRRAPKTVASFTYLVRKGVYDGTAFHRIVPDFVVQGGDPTGKGNGGPGYFVDEPPPPDTEYTKGTVAMAKTAAEPPGRSGSQFFVVVAADAGLPADYAVLGKVSKGMRAVERIAELGDPESGEEGTPLAPVVIKRIGLLGS